MLGGAPPHGLEARLAGGAFAHPLADETPRLDVVEGLFHAFFHAFVDDPGAGGVIAVFSRVGDRIAHVGDAALVDQVDDQLDLVHAFEIGHFRRVAGLDQGFVGGLNQRRQPAAQHRLFAEQVGLALLAEGGADDPGPPAADRRRVGEPDVVGVAGGVLVDGQQHRHPGAALVFGAHRMAGALGRDHEDVEVVAGLDEAEVDGQPVRHGQRRAFLQVVAEMVVIERRVALVGGQDHDHVGPPGGLGRENDLQLLGLGLVDRSRSRAQRHDHVLDARVPQVQRMRVALAAVTDDGDLLLLDQTDVSVSIIISLHDGLLPFRTFI